MAYERNGYWYRSVREGDQVRTEYLGAGPLAKLSAEVDALKREERELEWAAMRAEREAQREIDQAIGESGRLVRAVVAAVLLVSGYHTHRGQWRKRRDGKERELLCSSSEAARCTGKRHANIWP